MKPINRRELLQRAAAGGLLAGAPLLAPRAAEPIKPWEWVERRGEVTDTAGTPLQFMPMTPPDPEPLAGELEKYPRCPYCGMSRRQFHHTRHLIHYEDDRVDGTCSLHCAAISLSLNLDRGPKAIYAADAGAETEPRPLVNVDRAHYVIDPSKRGTMSGVSKWAYADRDRAEAAGERVVDFEAALTASYLDMARDTAAIRRMRAEKRRRAAQRQE
jgi:nitrous oxide reductase accessory protein NosL